MWPSLMTQMKRQTMFSVALSYVFAEAAEIFIGLLCNEMQRYIVVFQIANFQL